MNFRDLPLPEVGLGQGLVKTDKDDRFLLADRNDKTDKADRPEKVSQTEGTANKLDIDGKRETQLNCRPAGVLLMDAKTAFNKLNRAHALREVRAHWPSASRFITMYTTVARVLSFKTVKSRFLAGRG
eukprot:GHVN01026686.1.p1 GENE.GHVN01026686.1~~GHVN01026686.1.p1  ORF type:complete len:128 (+),score=13.56 GHVN01026686.1:292-675(+)